MSTQSQINCFVCRQLIVPKLVMRNIQHEWHIKRCPICDLTFVDPQPNYEAISSYYNGMYIEYTESYDKVKMQRSTIAVRHYLKEVQRITEVKILSVLDLGGGLGYYAKAFSNEGFDVTLVEQDKVSAKFARHILELDDVQELDANQFFSLNQKKFDIVFTRHVIEHVANPKTFVQNIKDCLAEGGILIIETDNNAGIELLFRPSTALYYMNLYKKSYAPSSYLSLLVLRPFAVDPPRHLFGFRMKNLSQLLSNSSLLTVKQVHYRLGHPVYWPNLPLPSWDLVSRDIKNLRLTKLVVYILDFALFPLRLALERMGLTSGICIYAKNKK